MFTNRVDEIGHLLPSLAERRDEDVDDVQTEEEVLAEHLLLDHLHERPIRRTDDLDMAPDDALLRVQLGELLRDMGELDESVRVLREAVALDPETASYWNSLGTVLGGKGDLGEAEGPHDR